MASSTFSERHYTTKEVAELWNVSMETVRRYFRDEPGVLILGTRNGTGRKPTKTGRQRNPTEHLRIPESVLARFHEQRSAGWSFRKIKRARRSV